MSTLIWEIIQPMQALLRQIQALLGLRHYKFSYSSFLVGEFSHSWGIVSCDSGNFSAFRTVVVDCGGWIEGWYFSLTLAIHTSGSRVFLFLYFIRAHIGRIEAFRETDSMKLVWVLVFGSLCWRNCSIHVLLTANNRYITLWNSIINIIVIYTRYILHCSPF